MVAFQRPFDLVVFGAGGFTGQLISEYINTHYDKSEIRWAVAGRNRAKLESVVSSLPKREPICQPEIIVADVGDLESLRNMCKSTKVIVSTVGPYAKYGTPLVDACIESNTDLADLTGEVHWISNLLDQGYHEKAQKTGTRIVNSSGYECVPFDLGVMAVGHMITAKPDGSAASSDSKKDQLKSLTCYMQEFKGGVSGGTIASFLGVFESANPSELIKVYRNPTAINRETKVDPAFIEPGDQTIPYFDRNVKAWTTLSFSALVTSRVIRRSQSLLGYPFGRFQYSETWMLRSGPMGFLKAWMTTFTSSLFLALMAIPPIRRMATRYVLPKPGEGPSYEVRQSGYFHAAMVGETIQGKHVYCKIHGKGDPGYSFTAKVLAETGIQLAKTRMRGGSGTDGCIGGLLTPGSAPGLGLDLLERLKRAELMSCDPQYAADPNDFPRLIQYK